MPLTLTWRSIGISDNRNMAISLFPRLIIPPCGVPLSVLWNISASTYPAFSHCLMISRLGVFPIVLRMYSWLMLSNAPLISASRIQVSLPPPIRQKHWAMASCVLLLNSARLSPVPLVFKTVRENFFSHGSSMFWCLSRIPHYPCVRDFFKSFGGLRLGTITAGFVAETAI